jgi:hypothetical protein
LQWNGTILGTEIEQSTLGDMQKLGDIFVVGQCSGKPNDSKLFLATLNEPVEPSYHRFNN